jgi:endothelin-converting enzyme
MYDYDAEILKKLRDHYASCLNEGYLNEVGDKPLVHVAKVIKQLYREEDTDITLSVLKNEQADWDLDMKFDGLTAAVAYLHSRGDFIALV